MGVADRVAHEVLCVPRLWRRGGFAPTQEAGHDTEDEPDDEEEQKEPEEAQEHGGYDAFRVARTWSICSLRPASIGSPGWRFNKSSQIATASMGRPDSMNATPLL